MFRCKRCHRVLTDEISIKAGYGPSCYLKETGSRLNKGRKSRSNKVDENNTDYSVTPPLFDQQYINSYMKEGNLYAEIFSPFQFTES